MPSASAKWRWHGIRGRDCLGRTFWQQAASKSALLLQVPVNHGNVPAHACGERLLCVYILLLQDDPDFVVPKYMHKQSQNK